MNVGRAFQAEGRASGCKGPELGVVLACLRDSKDEASMAGAGQVAIGREGNWCWHRLLSDRFLYGIGHKEKGQGDSKMFDHEWDSH